MIIKRLVLLGVVLSTLFPVYCQNANNSVSLEEISYDELLKLISEKAAGDGHVLIQDKLVYWKKSGQEYTYNETELEIPDFSKFQPSRMLWFRNCTFKLNFVWFDRRDAILFSLWLQGCTIEGQFALSAMKCASPPSFDGTTFNDFLDIEGMHISNGGTLSLDGCRLNYCNIEMGPSEIKVSITNNTATDSSDFRISVPSVSSANIVNNNFSKKNIHLSARALAILKFKNNHFNNIVLNSTIGSEFDLVNTKINGKFLMWESSFAGNPQNDIEWDSINAHKLGTFAPYRPYELYVFWRGKFRAERIEKFQAITGENNEDISNHQKFREIMGWYSMFLASFKSKNDLESYNACFIAIKELQSKRLKYLYESQRTFRSYFRWKLSQLLKFYVNHGTDPAQAIVVSIIIIACFGVFYFFFPSDWDTTSKKKLVHNFREFVQKNEKGYIIPFFVVLWGFALSLINALTLSLNAFITLGFGNIPTHGIARYVCVIEGFIGWFLLSIFTVALINQVL